MAKTTFKVNPEELEDLLKRCGVGSLQLPDFQRSWVWDEDRVLSLIASVSRGFPIGALMTLAVRPGTGADLFARRPIQGAATEANGVVPAHLLLDGQQRVTSLYQACWRREVVETITPKKKLVRRWFYIDILAALSGGDRDAAIITVPEDRRIKKDFDRKLLLDLSSPELEYQHLVFPLNRVFDWDEWQEGFGDYWIDRDDPGKRDIFKRFKNEVLLNIKGYQVPVIALDHDTSLEAVCLVFEKVNTGGKPLDAFELLTAMYAARGHKLRDDWLGTNATEGLRERLATFGRAADQKVGVLSKVAGTDVLQAIALLHSKTVRAEKAAAGEKESELPAIRATRQSLLDLPLEAYLRYRKDVEAGFKKAAKFLRQQNIHRVIDLPYQTQLVPLAAIFTELGDGSDHAGHLAKIARWYWCGIFGELYGSAVESRFAKDIVEVLEWLDGGREPTTVKEGVFRADRLQTLRTRLSAAYKGIHALLMREGARDFRSGQAYDVTVFFDEAVDIHHIFPEQWCKDHGIEPEVYDTVINKTPLTYRTNRILGGVAPSKYLARLETGGRSTAGDAPPIPSALLDEYLESHCIPVVELRADDFSAFMAGRRRRLLELIAKATGHPVMDEEAPLDEGEELSGQLLRDTEADAAT
jgi:hypothetical protein